MREYSIELDPAAVSGKIRNILGMCNSPRIKNARTAENEKKYFRELASFGNGRRDRCPPL